MLWIDSRLAGLAESAGSLQYQWTHSAAKGVPGGCNDPEAENTLSCEYLAPGIIMKPYVETEVPTT